jgi:hypothetical protein
MRAFIGQIADIQEDLGRQLLLDGKSPLADLLILPVAERTARRAADALAKSDERIDRIAEIRNLRAGQSDPAGDVIHGAGEIAQLRLAVK